jgi:hypothetical protein
MLGCAWAAHADQPGAVCTVDVIHALQEGSGIDPKLDRFKAKLEKPPFNAWKQFKLLGSNQLEIGHKASGKVTLPNGKIATLTYLDHVEQGSKHRVRTQLEVLDGSKRLMQTVFVLDEGGVVLQAGQKYEGGMLVLAVSCQSKH